MKLVLTRYYEKRAKNFFMKHQELTQRYKEILTLLLNDYNHPSLELHKLKGSMKDFWGISINYKYRMILILKISKDEIDLIDIGSHDDVY